MTRRVPLCQFAARSPQGFRRMPLQSIAGTDIKLHPPRARSVFPIFIAMLAARSGFIPRPQRPHRGRDDLSLITNDEVLAVDQDPLENPAAP